MTPEETSRRQYTRYLDWISSPEAGAPTGSSGAMAGALAASMIASVCLRALDDCKSEKAEDELRLMHDKALSLRRDLLALVEHGAQAASAVASSRRAGDRTGDSEPGRLRALLYASEVPLRTAESCHALLNLALRALGRVGVKAIAEIGTGAALAFAGVVGGIVTARTYLAGIPAGAGNGVENTRKRAERIFRDAEALRTQIIDRVRQHLP
ncbi:MAG TPA: cyclodeaminase/cyclohydrolase family protein [Patescibacteria group bacterium]|jgi:formiminotetrahydrofolate cyclodeaminase|nr:cyclodeaminase/cyclohydrolase family protein [Patescibacteria group bacterium]